jgi:hypothetical protein
MTTNKIFLSVALGIAFWFVAAMIVRFSGQAVFSDGNPMLILFFVLCFPLTYGFLFTTRKTLNLQYSEILRPIVVITLTATFLDGIALAWFRQLYGQTFEIALFGAALILWGVSLALLFGFILDSRSSTMNNQNLL